MDKIYTVKAIFENYESYEEHTIGIFINEKKANEIAQKWGDFYNHYKSIFCMPKNWKSNDGETEEWTDSSEYYTRQVKYRQIYEFKSIEVNSFDVNEDIFVKSKQLNENPNDELSLMIQWDRDYKLNKIIKKKKED